METARVKALRVNKLVGVRSLQNKEEREFVKGEVEEVSMARANKRRREPRCYFGNCHEMTWCAHEIINTVRRHFERAAARCRRDSTSRRSRPTPAILLF